MSDIFLSYARDDLRRARRLATALGTKGWQVWWDKDIPPGKTFDDVIQQALDSTRCVVVLWSERSTRSDWVKEEAAEGARRKILVPCLIDDVRIPLGFGRIQTARLVDWDGEPGHPDFEHLCAAIAAIIESSPTTAEAASSTPGESEHRQSAPDSTRARVGESPPVEPPAEPVIPAASASPVTYPGTVEPRLVYDGRASSVTAVASGSNTTSTWQRFRVPLAGALTLAILGSGYVVLAGHETRITKPDSGGSGPDPLLTVSQQTTVAPANNEWPSRSEGSAAFEGVQDQVEEASAENDGTDCPAGPHPGVWVTKKISSGACIGSGMITIVGDNREDRRLYEEAPGLCAVMNLECGMRLDYGNIGFCGDRCEEVSYAGRVGGGDEDGQKDSSMAGCVLEPEAGVWVTRAIAAGARIKSDMITLIGEDELDQGFYQEARTLCAATHLKCGMQLSYTNVGHC